MGSSAHYQREYRKRLREQGLVKKEVWILPEHARQLASFEKLLRQPGNPSANLGEQPMSELPQQWNTTTLYRALNDTQLFTSGAATQEMIDGVDPSIHIVMREYGDLPVFLTVSGDQIVVEAVLWSVHDVKDVAAFNDAVLRTHKYFPLSTISLDHLASSGDYYHMFGALSARSLIENIVLELEVLASNVIQATEAYSDYLTLSVEAQ